MASRRRMARRFTRANRHHSRPWETRSVSGVLGRSRDSAAGSFAIHHLVRGRRGPSPALGIGGLARRDAPSTMASTTTWRPGASAKRDTLGSLSVIPHGVETSTRSEPGFAHLAELQRAQRTVGIETTKFGNSGASNSSIFSSLRAALHRNCRVSNAGQAGLSLSPANRAAEYPAR